MVDWLDRRFMAWSKVVISAFDNNVVWLLFLNFSLLLSLKFAPAFIVFLYCLMARRDALIAGWRFFYVAKMPWLPWVPLLIYPVFACSYGGIPPVDDLLRHVTSWRHDYDYNNIYYNLRETIPHSSMWIVFELVGGSLDKLFGFWGAVFSIQAVAYLCCALICYKLAVFSLAGRLKYSSIDITIVVCLFFLSGIFNRSIDARPEIFLTFWALSAFFLSARFWVLLGVFLMPVYWLSIVYIPTVLLLKESRKNKILISGLLTFIFIFFWSFYSGIEWVNNIVSVYTYSINRLVPPGESGAMVYGLFSLALAPAFIMFVLHGVKSKIFDNSSILILLIWFLLPGQVRYIGIVGPLFLVYILRSLPELNFSKNISAVVALIAILMVFLSMPSGSRKLSSLPAFRLPPSAIVLTQFSVTTYLLPAINPGIKISPGMEFGSFRHEVQELIFNISNGVAPHCADIKYLGYTHLVESSLVQVSPCLRLIEVRGPWRLWLII